VDVHVSRLRRKLPSLRDRLLAIRNLGYRLEVDAPKRVATGS
jgi:DNA-binding response OmpR family regulator